MINLMFYDGNGAPLGGRPWSPRDGVVMLPPDATQLQIRLGSAPRYCAWCPGNGDPVVRFHPDGGAQHRTDVA